MDIVITEKDFIDPFERLSTQKGYNCGFEDGAKLKNQERVVQVRQSLRDKWENRVFFMEKNDKFLCWDGAETIEQAKKETCICGWTFMRELPTKRKITMQEIAEKFELDIDQIEIT